LTAITAQRIVHGEWATREALRNTMNDTRRRRDDATGMARWTEWKRFQRGVALLESWAQAWDFGEQGPKSGTPGSSFYTNLCFFLRHSSIPLGADDAQIAIYEGLVTRLGRPTPRGDQAPAN
jgi:hypothetical protein